jgi:hypothetical protein
MQSIYGPFTSSYSKVFVHGEQARIMISFNLFPNWSNEFARDFIRSQAPKIIISLVALVHTSIGVRFENKPEASLLEHLQQSVSQA